jgi:hypothetical protein
MIFETFLAQIQNKVCVTTLYKFGCDWVPRACSWRHDESKAEKTPALCVEWYTGGMSGGNCWNDREPTYEASDNPPEELTDLDVVLTMFWPDMTFLQYKELTRALLKEDSYTQSEYYGNTSNYSYKLVVLKDLFNYLVEKGKI